MSLQPSVAVNVAACVVLLFTAMGCNTPADIRLYCIRIAHKTVKVPESEAGAREEMVREVYLRCLEKHGVPDAPVGR